MDNILEDKLNTKVEELNAMINTQDDEDEDDSSSNSSSYVMVDDIPTVKKRTDSVDENSNPVDEKLNMVEKESGMLTPNVSFASDVGSSMDSIPEYDCFCAEAYYGRPCGIPDTKNENPENTEEIHEVSSIVDPESDEDLGEDLYEDFDRHEEMIKKLQEDFEKTAIEHEKSSIVDRKSDEDLEEDLDKHREEILKKLQEDFKETAIEYEESNATDTESEDGYEEPTAIGAESGIKDKESDNTDVKSVYDNLDELWECTCTSDDNLDECEDTESIFKYQENRIIRQLKKMIADLKDLSSESALRKPIKSIRRPAIMHSSKWLEVTDTPIPTHLLSQKFVITAGSFVMSLISLDAINKLLRENIRNIYWGSLEISQKYSKAHNHIVTDKAFRHTFLILALSNDDPTTSGRKRAYLFVRQVPVDFDSNKTELIFQVFYDISALKHNYTATYGHSSLPLADIFCHCTNNPDEKFDEIDVGLMGISRRYAITSSIFMMHKLLIKGQERSLGDKLYVNKHVIINVEHND